ncbi:MAG: hypothetical protein ACOC44_05960 [Promethearchaeia archaeon]
MRPSRVFRFVVKFFLILLTSSTSIVSFFGGYSAVLILSNDENIQVPDGEIQFDFPVFDENFTDNAENITVVIPFKITNAGFFNLEDLVIEMVIDFVYEDKTDNNKTKRIKIFEKPPVEFETIEAGETYKDEYNADETDFAIEELNKTISEINADGPLEFLADISLSAKYSLKLLSFQVTLTDVPIGEGGF